MLSNSRTSPGPWITPLLLALLSAGLAPGAGAQATGAPLAKNGHAVVCADGIKTYASLTDVPVPYDTLVMPDAPPVRITNAEEARAAERRMHERAGSIGATGVVVVDVRTETSPGEVELRRRVTPVFVPADTARAYAACRGAKNGG